jgi:hypothetical protein
MKIALIGIKKNAPAILSSFDLSFTTHSSQSQSCDTFPLNVFLYILYFIISEIQAYALQRAKS